MVATRPRRSPPGSPDSAVDVHTGFDKLSKLLQRLPGVKYEHAEGFERGQKAYVSATAPDAAAAAPRQIAPRQISPRRRPEVTTDGAPNWSAVVGVDQDAALEELLGTEEERELREALERSLLN